MENEVVLGDYPLILSFLQSVVRTVWLFLLFAILVQWLLLLFVLRVFCRHLYFVPSTKHPILAFRLQVVFLKLVLLSPEFDHVLLKFERPHLVVLVEI